VCIISTVYYTQRIEQAPNQSMYLFYKADLAENIIYSFVTFNGCR